MSFQYINKVVYAVGRVTLKGVNLLGTAALVGEAGRFATVAHVTGTDDTNLAIVLKEYTSINDFQDTSDLSVKILPAKIHSIDPLTDLCVLSAEITAASTVQLGKAEDVNIGDTVHLFGYPHANHGRLVLTYQRAEVGARILISNQGIKTHLVSTLKCNNERHPA